MGILSRLFGRGKPPLQVFREDLANLGVADFLEKHAGNTKDSRLLMVAQMVAISREQCTEQEKTAMKKALVAASGIEAADGWTLTIGALGTILGESTDQDARSLIKEVLSAAENGFRASGKEENRHLLEFVPIARTGDFEAILAYQHRFGGLA
jgi:hypothetical protein